MPLGEFLQASSIHGLRYLTETKGWLGRLLWLALILTSFSVAMIISYANVVNWQNSPVTITKASTVMLKDENVSLPMITVCPQKPDYNAFIVNYLNKYYSRENDTVKLYETLVTTMTIKIQEDRLREEEDLLQILTNEEFQALCNGIEENETKECHLIMILFSLAESYCDRHRTEARTILFEFVFLEDKSEGLSNEGFLNFIGTKFRTLI